MAWYFDLKCSLILLIYAGIIALIPWSCAVLITPATNKRCQSCDVSAEMGKILSVMSNMIQYYPPL